MQVLTLLSKFQAKDAQAASGMTALLRELRGRVGTETGFVSYEILSTADDDRTSWVLESWETQADADGHAKLVASDGTAARATPLLAGPIETSRLTPIQ